MKIHADDGGGSANWTTASAAPALGFDNFASMTGIPGSIVRHAADPFQSLSHRQRAGLNILSTLQDLYEMVSF